MTHIKLHLTAEKLCLLIGGFIISMPFMTYTLDVLNIHCRLLPVFVLSLICTTCFYCFFCLMVKEVHVTDLIFWGLAAIASVLYYWIIRRPVISFDTWQVYDMSRFLFQDFGYMSTIRQHILNTHYEMAFPPLFPFLIAVINSILDMGIMSVYLLNFLFLLLLIGLLKRLGDCSGQHLTTAIASVIFICTPLFRSIFRGGLTQLAGFVFFVWIMQIMLKQDFSRRDCFFCTVLAGIGLMNRFDFLAVAGVICLSAPFRVNRFNSQGKQRISMKNRLCWMVVNIGIMVATCSSWILYSIIRFGKVFVTDNGRRLIHIEDTRPTTYFSSQSSALTISDDFVGWLKAFQKRGLSSFQSLIDLVNEYYIFKYLTIFVICGILALLFYDMISLLAKEKYRCGKRWWVLLKLHTGIIIMACAAICQEFTFILTGYEDTRYHILFLFVINWIIFFVSEKMMKLIIRAIQAPYLGNCIKTVLVATLILLSGLFLHDGWRTLQRSTPYLLSRGLRGEDTVHTVTVLTEQETVLDIYLQKENASCLMVYRNEPLINIPRTCALLHSAATISPVNLNTENASAFVRDFDVDYVFSSDEDFNHIFSETMELTETPVEYLYKINY